jgi:hypothetical protein
MEGSEKIKVKEKGIRKNESEEKRESGKMEVKKSGDR